MMVPLPDRPLLIFISTLFQDTPETGQTHAVEFGGSFQKKPIIGRSDEI